VLGFANLPGSELVDPPLTTMGYDREQMGQLTIAALFSLVRGEPAPGKIVVPAQFLVRRSCAPPAVAGEERILLRTAPEDGGTSHGHA
jgi:LacI family transcriptional regulator/LacI family xylobiose transport system transcriptional regulator